VIATVVQLAEAEEAVTEHDIAREWGWEFLQLAQVIDDVDMTDQNEKWGVFSLLNDLDPAALARENHCSFARSCKVLRDNDGYRYVHVGWFLTFVRRAAGGVRPAEVANQMSAVGWLRRGKRGAIKATRPMDGSTLIHPFYVVPPNWEAGRRRLTY
jgi:hypothetical protein